MATTYFYVDKSTDCFLYYFCVGIMLRKYPAVSQLAHALSVFGLFFWLGHAAYGMLVPQPKIDPVSTAAKAQSPNHWTTRGRSSCFSFNWSMVDLQCCVHPSSFNIAYRQAMKLENMFTNHLYNKGSRELPSSVMVRTWRFHYQGQGSIPGG